MRLFNGLIAVVVVILSGILLWDLVQEKLTYPGKKVIIYAGMFGPGEPMQLFYAGPPANVAPEHPFGPDAVEHWHALRTAWPEVEAALVTGYRECFGRPLPPLDDPDPQLVEQYRGLKPDYARRLASALGRLDRSSRLSLYHAFARAHPQFETEMILTFERLHPAYTIGAFEDFERLHPDYAVAQRWDGRWVLSANRGRFLTGSDVPDLITGSQAELRILMRENLALALDRALPPGRGIKPEWVQKGILDGEKAYDDPDRTFRSEFYDWVIDRARYEITPEDRDVSGNPYPVGQPVLYLMPRMAQTAVVYYNRAHFKMIGRDPDDIPETNGEFEQICRQVLAAGKEPIAQDGMTYVTDWWGELVTRIIGDDVYRQSVIGGLPRFAGADADPRYLEIAQRLRRWRGENFWMKGFSASKWPGAQRDFGTGRCTFLHTGTWLPTEIAGTRSWDPEVFDLGCFFFPTVEGGTGDPYKMSCHVQGYAVPRDGDEHEGAVLLLRYLTARSQKPMVEKLNYMPAVKGVAFPAALRDIESRMVNASADDFVSEGPPWYSPKWSKFVFTETANRFFVIRSDNSSPEEFVEELERRSQEHYRKIGRGT
ncbi:MAG TPA: ABC transporter substrate-binding protein [Phycisphaerae bacterium]|nr:ABC transporter substrate-binding protein [Phycisphaerae bacterium]